MPARSPNKPHKCKPDPKKEVKLMNFVDQGETFDGYHVNRFCKCGKQLKKNEYSNGPRWVHINHGSWL